RSAFLECTAHGADCLPTDRIAPERITSCAVHFRQPRDIRRNPPRLVAQLGSLGSIRRRTESRMILKARTYWMNRRHFLMPTTQSKSCEKRAATRMIYL